MRRRPPARPGPEAAATLAGSVAGPFLAQAASLTAVAAAAGLVTLGAAALAFRTVLPGLPGSHGSPGMSEHASVRTDDHGGMTC